MFSKLKRLLETPNYYIDGCPHCGGTGKEPECNLYPDHFMSDWFYPGKATKTKNRCTKCLGLKVHLPISPEKSFDWSALIVVLAYIGFFIVLCYALGDIFYKPFL